MIDSRKNNYRLLFSLEDEATGTDQGASAISGVEIELKNMLTQQTWLKYAYPTKEGFLPLEKLPDNSALVLQITKAQSATAPLGRIIMEATYLFENTNFTDGVQAETETCELFHFVS